ncbi:MAG: ATP-binding protein, partial [Lactobacillus iners]|nr:ATP-binding protein [Lactobacillus iners]
TYMMAGLANGLAQEGNEVVFLHVPSFIAGLSDHFKDNSLTDKIMKIATATIVIFDDIGAESLTEWSRDEVLGVILQRRMDNQLPTFFTSNMNFDALTIHFAQVKNSYDDVKAKRLMERIRCLSKEVFVGGENRRR